MRRAILGLLGAVALIVGLSTPAQANIAVTYSPWEPGHNNCVDDQLRQALEFNWVPQDDAHGVVVTWVYIGHDPGNCNNPYSSVVINAVWIKNGTNAIVWQRPGGTLTNSTYDYLWVDSSVGMPKAVNTDCFTVKINVTAKYDDRNPDSNVIMSKYTCR